MANSQNPLLIISLALGILSFLGALYVFWNMRSLNRLRSTFFAGKAGVDLEEALQRLSGEIKNLKEEHLVLERALTVLQNRFGFAIQQVGMVRFNPLQEDGGNFSFCLALLDAHNTGIVLTSMHGRQQARIYSKQIFEGKSEALLTEEEQQAISLANQKTKVLREY
jgi:hypothetical protein